jgi:hypothetical protein
VAVLESGVQVEPTDAKVRLLKKDASDVVRHRSLELDELARAERCSHEGCLSVRVERGGRRGVIVLSVQGREKCIEEDLAELVKLVAGEEVEPEEIHKWLRARGYRVIELIERASVNALEKAFPRSSERSKSPEGSCRFPLALSFNSPAYNFQKPLQRHLFHLLLPLSLGRPWSKWRRGSGSAGAGRSWRLWRCSIPGLGEATYARS